MLARPVVLAPAHIAPTAPASDRAPRAGVVLMVEDAGRPGSEVTERLGEALYGRVLEAGPYARVARVVGRGADPTARLAAAVREVAAAVDVVDVVASVHTTTRDPAELQRLLPPAARRLRLVYSTACHGAEEERRAWVAVGARTVVTHVGVNVPVVALPRVLTAWLAGAPIGAAVARAYREALEATHLALALPGAGARAAGFDPRGSRPVVTGDAALTIGAPSVVPAALACDPRRGGPLGLLLRALAGRFVAGPAEVEALLRRVALPPGALPAGVLAQVERLSPGLDGRGDGQVELALRRRVDVPLPGNARRPGVVLRLGRAVTLRPSVVDAAAGRVTLHVAGVWVRVGGVDLRLTALALAPDGRGGQRVRVTAGLLGVLPVWRTFCLGGSAPAPVLATDAPRLEPDLAAVAGEAR